MGVQLEIKSVYTPKLKFLNNKFAKYLLILAAYGWLIGFAFYPTDPMDESRILHAFTFAFLNTALAICLYLYLDIVDKYLFKKKDKLKKNGAGLVTSFVITMKVLTDYYMLNF